MTRIVSKFTRKASPLLVHLQSPAMVFSSFFLGSCPAPRSPMPFFHYSSHSAHHSNSFASRFLSMLCLARSLFRKRMTGWSRANQFMRLHLQKVPQPPLGRGGPCEASPLYSCCPPLQKFRYLYQNLRPYPNLHIRLGLHLTSWTFCVFWKLPYAVHEIIAFTAVDMGMHDQVVS